MIPVSVCTIAKNEEKHIEHFLQALKKGLNGYPFEIVLVDTGSTDRTKELIEAFTEKNPELSLNLSFFEWTGDFSAAKNHAVGLAKNNFVLVLDADEYLTGIDNTCFDLMARQYPQGIGLIKRINQTQLNGIGNATTEEIPRFFDRRLFHYEGIIHEQLIPLKADRVSLPITIDHYGYVGTPEEIRAKADRNNALLFKMLEDTPDDPYLYYQLGQSYAIIGDSENACRYYGKGLEYDVDPKLDYVRQMVTGYGHALLSCGRQEEALGFEGIYEEFKDSSDFLCLMGLIYLRNGKIDEAYAEFENALRAKESSVGGSDSYLAYYNMAVIDETFGRIEKAVSLYEKCGEFAPAKERLTELKKRGILS